MVTRGQPQTQTEHPPPYPKGITGAAAIGLRNETGGELAVPVRGVLMPIRCDGDKTSSAEGVAHEFSM